RRVELEPAATGYSVQRANVMQPLRLLAVLAGLGLLAVCANIANLLLTRAASRRRELAGRQALGARRFRLMRQLLTESLLLGGAGGALGLLFGAWGAKLLAAALAAGPLPSGVEDHSLMLDPQLDWRLVAFSAGLCLLVSVMFGIAPALRSFAGSLVPALRERGVSGGAGGRFGGGKVLGVARVGLWVVLLIGAGLLVRTVHNLRSADVGFDRESLLLVWAAPVRTGRTIPELSSLADEVRRTLSSLPGVQSVSVSGGGVLDGRETGGQSE